MCMFLFYEAQQTKWSTAGKQRTLGDTNQDPSLPIWVQSVHRAHLVAPDGVQPQPVVGCGLEECTHSPGPEGVAFLLLLLWKLVAICITLICHFL